MSGVISVKDRRRRLRNMKNNPRLHHLIDSYLRGGLSQLDRAELLSYFEDPVYRTEIEDRLGFEYERETGDREMSAGMQEQTLAQIFGYKHTAVMPTRRTWKIWRRPAIAAAIALILFGAGLFYYNAGFHQTVSRQSTYRNDIDPGTSGATLTLANGRKIRLSDAANGELATEAGVVISKTADNQLVYEIKGQASDGKAMNVLSTAKGETYQVRLPDGSMVWMNAASTLTYPVNLGRQEKRMVKFEGEGYFDIAKDKDHPFVIESRNQQIEVLGTQFNINSYADEPLTRTTLVEGSVSVNGSTRLSPNQQARVGKSDITVIYVRPETYTDWKNGIFNFENEPLQSVMRKIARWYDVQVDYASAPTAGKTYSGTISKYAKISAVLTLLEESEGIHFKVDGRKVTVIN